MFDVLVESTSERRGARTLAYFAVSSAVWLVIFATVAIAGVFAYDAQLDASFDKISLVAVPVQPPPPARAVARPQSEPQDTPAFRSVIAVPDHVSPPRPAPPAIGSLQPGSVDGGDPNGQPDGLLGYNGPGVTTNDGAVGDGPRVAPPPPAPPDPPVVAPRPPAPKKPVISRVLSGIATKRVEPRYPQMALAAGVQGNVVVEVTVSEQGDVLSAHVISGPPLLRDAALNAAREWRFTPTILGDSPVKVIGTITFSFKR
jgi:protein TonB